MTAEPGSGDRTGPRLQLAGVRGGPPGWWIKPTRLSRLSGADA